VLETPIAKWCNCAEISRGKNLRCVARVIIKNCVSGITQLDQVPAAKFTLYRREQIEIGKAKRLNSIPSFLMPMAQNFFLWASFTK
jgi:hypothetical protein